MFRRKKKAPPKEITDAEAERMKKLKQDAHEKMLQAKRDFDEAFGHFQGFVDFDSFLKEK